jgi:hypothetical protein
MRPVNEVEIDVVEPQVGEGPFASWHHHVRGMVCVPQLKHRRLLFSLLGFKAVLGVWIMSQSLGAASFNFIFTRICGLFTDAVSRPDYVEPKVEGLVHN